MVHIDNNVIVFVCACDGSVVTIDQDDVSIREVQHAVVSQPNVSILTLERQLARTRDSGNASVEGHGCVWTRGADITIANHVDSQRSTTDATSGVSRED